MLPVLPVLPALVQTLVETYLRAVDRAAPGLVQMVYLTGSLTLDDYRPGLSDVDFLALTARPPDAADLAELSTVHGDLPDRPHFDGMYLDRAVLADPPDAEQAVPHAVNGVFRTDEPCGELNPLLWLSLVRHGRAVRGPDPASLGMALDSDRLRRWSLGHLDGYWASHADTIRAAAGRRAASAPVGTDAVVWTVLGPARLHYTHR